MLLPTTHTPGRPAVGLAGVSMALPDEAGAAELASFCDVLLRSLSPSEAGAPALPTKAAVATAARRPQAGEPLDPADLSSGLVASLLAPQTPIAAATAKAGTALLAASSGVGSELAGMTAADLLAVETDAGGYALSTDQPTPAPVLLNSTQRPSFNSAKLASTVHAAAEEIDPAQRNSPNVLSVRTAMVQVVPDERNELHKSSSQSVAAALSPAELALMSVATGSGEAQPAQARAPAGAAQAEPDSSPARVRPSDAPRSVLHTDFAATGRPTRSERATKHETLPASEAVAKPAATPLIAASRQTNLDPGAIRDSALETNAAVAQTPSPVVPRPDASPALSLAAMATNVSLNPASTAILRSTQRPASSADAARPGQPGARTDVNSSIDSEAAIQADPSLLSAAALRLTPKVRSTAVDSARQPAPEVAERPRPVSLSEAHQATVQTLESAKRDATSPAADASPGAAPLTLPHGSPDSANVASNALTTQPVLLHHPGSSTMDSNVAYVSQRTVDTAISYATLSQPIGSEGWDKALGQQVLRLHSSGHQVTELQLNPPGLGPLKITLDMNDRQMQLTFVSDHAAVRAAVEAAVPELRSSLAHSGISLGNTSVSSESPSQSTFSQAQSHASGQRGYPKESLPDRSADPARPTTPAPRRRHGDSIDTYA